MLAIMVGAILQLPLVTLAAIAVLGNGEALRRLVAWRRSARQ
jgi:hypothetical protein